LSVQSHQKRGEQVVIGNDPYNLIVCGVGGQGNILMARLIGRVLARDGYVVNIGETFGAAQRGGGVFSSLRISKKRSYHPLVPAGRGHGIVGLEPLETLRMIHRFGNPEVFVLSNDRMVYPVDVLGGRDQYPDFNLLCGAVRKASRESHMIAATNIAMELGGVIMTNMVMLGALVETGALPLDAGAVTEEMSRTVPAAKLEQNLEALRRGAEEIKRSANILA
jgi:indolepyruvate ferredoxin oxidoreductase beta subunit